MLKIPWLVGAGEGDGTAEGGRKQDHVTLFTFVVRKLRAKL